MHTAINNITNSFLVHYKKLGGTKEAILDELDMAVYQYRELRDTPLHDEVLCWGERVLNRNVPRGT